MKTNKLGYEWRNATDFMVVAFKRYEKNPLINQVVYVYKDCPNRAFIEWNTEKYISNNQIKDLQEALDLTIKEKELLKYEDFDLYGERL